MRRFKMIVLGLITTLALTTAGCAMGKEEAGAKTPVVVGLTYIPNVQFSPFYAAQAQGAFSDAPNGVKIRHHGESEGLFDALRAGEENLVVAGADEMLQARAEGLDLIAVGQYYSSYPVVIIVPADSPIKGAADLKGKRIGIPGRYGSSWFGLLAALDGVKLKETDVDIKEIGYTQEAALKTDAVDAVIGFSNSDLVRFKTVGLNVRSLPLVNGKPVPLVGHVLVTTRTYATVNAKAVRAVVSGMIAGMRKVAADPKFALEVTKKEVPTLSQPDQFKSAQAVLAGTIPLWKPQAGQAYGKLKDHDWQVMAKFMSEHKLLKGDPRIDSAVTNDFLVGK